MKTDGNDPVNPMTSDSHLNGLTKREYFAAQAMAGLLAQSPAINYAAHADDAVRMADALIAELNKGQS